MFGRRGSRDNDLAVAAQRRLAGLAQQLEHVRAGGRAADDPGTVEGKALRVEAAPEPSPAAAREFAAPSVPAAAAAAGRHGPAGRHVRPDAVRWRLTPHQVTVIALLVVAAVLAAAWWVLRSVPEAEPVQLTSQRQLPSTSTPDPGAPPVSTPAGGAPSSPPTIVGPADVVIVDVAGRVRHPGIVELPVGSRVVDALEAAGGARPRVETSSLNLARLLVDGEQILVGIDAVPAAPGLPPPAVTGGVATGPPAPIDLNLATQPELEELPGIGPVTAAAILAWRTEHGGFTSVDELLEVSGIGDATLAEIAPFVRV